LISVVVTQESDDLTPVNHEIDILQRRDQAETPGDILHIDKRSTISVFSHLTVAF